MSSILLTLNLGMLAVALTLIILIPDCIVKQLEYFVRRSRHL